jgi:hypothetical protein
VAPVHHSYEWLLSKAIELEELSMLSLFIIHCHQLHCCCFLLRRRRKATHSECISKVLMSLGQKKAHNATKLADENRELRTNEMGGDPILERNDSEKVDKSSGQGAEHFKGALQDCLLMDLRRI